MLELKGALGTPETPEDDLLESFESGRSQEPSNHPLETLEEDHS